MPSPDHFGKDGVGYAKLRLTGKGEHHHRGGWSSAETRILVSITTRIIGGAFACAADHDVRQLFRRRFLS